MEEKKKPRSCGGAGADGEVGITDSTNCNTIPAVMSSDEIGTPDSGDLPVMSAFLEDGTPVDADAHGGAGSGPAKGDGRPTGKDDGSMTTTMTAALNAARPKRESFDSIIRDCTAAYIASLKPNSLPTLEEGERALSEAVFLALNLRNTNAVKEDRMAVPRHLEATQIAELMIPLCNVGWIALERGDGQSERLGIYDGRTGLYVFEQEYFDAAIARVHSHPTKTLVDAVMRCLRAKCRERGIVKDVYRGNLFVKVGNGIYNRSTGGLRPNTPDIVFVNGVSTEYDPDAVNVTRVSPVTGKEHDVESIMLEWANYDEKRCRSLWQTLAMLVRPNEKHKRAIFPTSPVGNNGKGTFCALGVNVIGADNVLTLDFAGFADKFALYGIERYTAVICDENNVKGFNELPAAFKSAVTEDALSSEGKGIQRYRAKFHGTIIECVNSRLRVNDTTPSFMRRIGFIRFEREYEGVEDPWIKNEFLADPDVLKYVLKKALETDVPYGVEFCADDAAMLAEFDRGNNYVAEFVHDVLSRTAWDIIPAKLGYEMYKYWLADEVPAARAMNRIDFINEVGDVMRRYGEQLGWKWVHGGDSKVAVGSKMTASEPLLAEYRMDGLRAGEYDERTRRVVMINHVNPSMVPKTKCHGFVRVDGPAPASPCGGDGGPDADAQSPDSTSADAYSAEKAERQQVAVDFVEDIVTSTQWDLLPWDYLSDRVSRYMLSTTGDPVAFVTDEAFHAAVEGLLRDKPGLGFDVVRGDDGTELEWPTWELMRGPEDVHTADACDISRDQRSDRAVLWAAPLLCAGGREVPDRMYMTTTHPSMAGPVRRSALEKLE